MNNKTKIIIGSGLSGPLLAIYLAQRKYSVKLYEKRPDMRQTDISAGRSINLALSHRGIRALKAANVFDEIEPNLIPMKGRMIHHRNGELEFQAYSTNSHEYINSVSRGELNNILMNHAEGTGNVEINFSHSLIKIDETNIDYVLFKAHRGINFVKECIDYKTFQNEYIQECILDHSSLLLVHLLHHFYLLL